jgi:hypothetical protein
MTMSKELFLAILSMDSYNRGYGAGLGSEEDGLGSAIRTKIGTATVYDTKGDTAAKSAGFYAISYTWGNETVISYRGTDNPDALGLNRGASDVWSGWITGTGTLINARQAALAAEFYNSVTGGDVIAGESGGAILTGHSLGGELPLNPAAAH